MNESNFKFGLGQAVRRVANNREGIIYARAEYIRGLPAQYNFEYTDGNGDVASVWLTEGELSEL